MAKAGRDQNGMILWDCPGCHHAHAADSRWTFNGDMEAPTLSPSFLSYGDEKTRTETDGKHGHRCHCFVKDGKIQFLSDCTHELKGKTVDMVDW